MRIHTIVTLALGGILGGLLLARVAQSRPQAAPSPQPPAVSTVDWVGKLTIGWLRSFDQDQDGQVSAAEYAGSGGITTKAGRWTFARLDADGDGHSGRAELGAALDGYFRPRLTELAAEALRHGDRDGDGRLDREEFARAYEAGIRPVLGGGLPDLREALTRHDRDRDGKLQQAELELAIGEAFVKAYAPVGVELEPALRQELVAMFAIDQQVRRERAPEGTPAMAALVRRMQEVDRRHAERLKVIIGKYGWPTRSLVGDDGAIAAWVIVQHADHDLALQRRCLPLIEAAARVGEARWSDVAYLTDRVRVNEGKPQLYGSQFHTVDGELVPRPIEGADSIDTRRDRMGLIPLADYVRQLQRLR